MTDDRSERLRKRRKQSAENVERQRLREGSQSSDTESHSDSSSVSDTPSDEGGDREAENEGSTVSIKEEQVGTYMYLPDSQTKEMRRLYNVLKAEYEFEYEDEFQKNRHFYPLVVQYGLDSLDGLDASEIRDRLEGIS